jgi:hypothetical protein
VSRTQAGAVAGLERCHTALTKYIHSGRDIDDFYNESGRRPLNKPSGKPSGNPSNKNAPENALTPYDIKDINTMKDEIIHDRFERHAHHT